MTLRRLTLLSLFGLLTLAPPRLDAQVVVPGDDPYWTKSWDEIQYIYPREHAVNLPELHHYNRYFRDKYAQSFRWRLDETWRVVVASTRNQIANGFATPTPLLKTVHYPTGMELLDSFAQDSFLLALSSHETAHLYQLSPKSRLSGFVKNIFGNVPFLMTPLGIPIFVFPNAFLPNFLLEGNAVLNESVIGVGGRLWSGEVRAEVLAQVRAGEVGPARLMNPHLDFPLGQDYHHGGYFALFLSERFGVDRANQFFVTHAERDFWPFNMNKSFRAHFGASYTRLLHDFYRWLRPLAESHRPADGQVLTRTLTRPTFNADEGEIFFVGNPNGRIANRLYVVSRTDGRLSERTTALPVGKAFRRGREFVTVSSEWINPTNQRYALFHDSLRPHPGTIDSIVQDERGGIQLAGDARNSYRRNHLLKNGAFFDLTGSSAVLDDQGRAIYFRQVGGEQVLYRDRQALFKFPGYYAIPTEAIDGTIDFIASTPYGASLFRWQNGEIWRQLPYDNVVEARQLKDGRYLVAAVDADGYQIQLVKPTPARETPALWQYQLPTTSQPVPDAVSSAPAATDDEREYSEFSQLRYGLANLNLGAGHTQLAVLFTDPLAWNSLELGAAFGGGDNAFSLAYENQRHRLGYTLVADYQREKHEPLLAPNYVEIEASAWLAANYRLWRWRRWSSVIQLGPSWTEESTIRHDFERLYGARAKWNTTYMRIDHGLAYQPHRLLHLSLETRTDVAARTGRKADSRNSGTLILSGDVGRQTFLTAIGSWAIAEQDTIEVSYLSDISQQLSLPTLLSDGDAREVREWEVTGKQVFDWSFYLARFPVSLRRFAPFVSLRDTYTDEHREIGLVPKWRQEVALGVEFETLFLHLVPARITPVYKTWKVGGRLENDYQLNASIKRDF